MKQSPPSQPTREALAYEQSIPAAERLRNGQYYTPAPVCDFMLALIMAAHHAQGANVLRDELSPLRVLEPGCGPGSFLLRLINRLQSTAENQPSENNPENTLAHLLRHPLEDCLGDHSEPKTGNQPQLELHGVELDPGSAALAQTLLPACGPGYTTQISLLNFISPQADALGPFDWIIGNPPYVRQEHIAQSRQIDKKAMLAHLEAKYTPYLQRFPAQKALFSQTADLYLWFFLQATHLLKPGGLLAFITSNSWLNTAYGQQFQQFLTDHFQILTLAESACERWFEDAAVNSLIVVLKKKHPDATKTHPDNPAPNSGAFFPAGCTTTGPSQQALARDEDPVKQAQRKQNQIKQNAFEAEQFKQVKIKPTQFIRLLTPLKLWLPSPQAGNYWAMLEEQVRALFNATTSPDVYVQINQVAASQLQTKPFEGHWALPLRAPRELTDLLSQPSLWQTLDRVGRIRYPLKTGINAFFYLNAEKAAHWGIEPEFLFPVLRSSREVKGYTVQPGDLQTVLFSCPYTLEELAAQGKTGARAYILWGETQSAPARQKRAQATPWPQVPSIQGNRPWHYTKPLAPAHLLCPRFIDQRFFFPLCVGEMMEDQTFYGLTVYQQEQYPPDLIAAMLNGTLSYLIAEYSARTNLGEGVLQFSRGDMARLPLLKPELYSPAEQDAIRLAFQRLQNRPILPLGQELFNPDRIALDALLLEPVLPRKTSQHRLDLRDRLARQLLSRVQERQTLAQSAKRQPPAI